MIDWEKVNSLAENGNTKPPRRVEKSDEEWKKELTDEQFQITRKAGTEQPGTGEHCESYKPGLYACICCGTELFDSTEKFGSGTGWPSFTEPVQENVISYKEDFGLMSKRIETECSVCDAHLGHVFPDGPEPTGLRYCINSAALKLVEEKA